MVADVLSSESLLVELLDTFVLAFEVAEVGVATGLVVVVDDDGFFLLSSDESEEDVVSCLFFLPAFTGVVTVGFFANGVTGVVGAICLNEVKFRKKIKRIKCITFN